MKTGKEGRRTGLGFTALADMIAALGFSIDSDEAIAFVEKIMKEKCRAEFDCSIDMSLERGSFVGFNKNRIRKKGTKRNGEPYRKRIRYRIS